MWESITAAIAEYAAEMAWEAIKTVVIVTAATLMHVSLAEQAMHRAGLELVLAQASARQATIPLASTERQWR